MTSNGLGDMDADSINETEKKRLEPQTVRELLQDSLHWTKGAMARSAPAGNPCLPSSPKAQCWCLTGATRKIYGHVEDVARDHKIALAIEKIFPNYRDYRGRYTGSPTADQSLIQLFNDDWETTHADILLVLEEAKV